MDKNLSKLVKILISEKIALAAVFYFGQVFVFCRFINKNVLEWFLLIICKEHTLTRSTNLFSRNHLTLCFSLKREGRQMPNTERLPYQTDKSSHRRFSITKDVLKNFAIFTGKHLCWSLFFIKLQTFRPSALLKRNSNTGVFLLRNFCETLILGKICIQLLLN